MVYNFVFLVDFVDAFGIFFGSSPESGSDGLSNICRALSRKIRVATWAHYTFSKTGVWHPSYLDHVLFYFREGWLLSRSKNPFLVIYLRYWIAPGNKYLSTFLRDRTGRRHDIVTAAASAAKPLCIYISIIFHCVRDIYIFCYRHLASKTAVCSKWCFTLEAASLAVAS